MQNPDSTMPEVDFELVKRFLIGTFVKFDDRWSSAIQQDEVFVHEDEGTPGHVDAFCATRDTLPAVLEELGYPNDPASSEQWLGACERVPLHVLVAARHENRAKAFKSWVAWRDAIISASSLQVAYELNAYLRQTRSRIASHAGRHMSEKRRAANSKAGKGNAGKGSEARKAAARETWRKRKEKQASAAGLKPTPLEGDQNEAKRNVSDSSLRDKDGQANPRPGSC